MKLSVWQKRVLRVVASVALVVGIFWFIPFREVVANLRGARLGYVIGSFVLMLAIAYLEGVQLWLLLRRAKLPITSWDVFETKLVTRFYGQFMPSELMASAVKLYRLAGPTGQWGEVMAALALVRVVNMAGLLALGVVFWAIDMPQGAGRWIGLLMIGAIAALAIAHFVMVSPSVNRFVRSVMSPRLFAWLQGRVLEKARRIGAATVDSYRLFGDMVWTIMALGLVRHALGIVSFAFVAQALGVHLSLMTIAWVRVVLQAVMMLPITLSGIGVREGSLVILLQEYAVPASQAVALAFLMFLIGLCANSLGGLMELRSFLVRGRSTIVQRSDGQ